MAGSRPDLSCAPRVGETLIALPTLIHRGPGNRSGQVARKVLFFALRPRYGDEGGSGAVRSSTTAEHGGSCGRGQGNDGASDSADAPPSTDHASEEQVGSYDDATQIHVGWLLSRPGYGLDPKRHKEVLAQYKRHGVDLESFGRGGEAHLEV